MRKFAAVYDSKAKTSFIIFQDDDDCQSEKWYVYTTPAIDSSNEVAEMVEALNHIQRQ